MPIQEVVRDFFVDLLGKGAAVEQAKPFDITPESDGLTVAIYNDDRGRLAAVAVAELLLAAGSGAALALVPATVLDDVKRENVLPESLADNFREIVNIFAGVLNGLNSPHLELADLIVLPAELPTPVWEVIRNPTNQRWYDVTVEGYGGGKIALLVV
jgi:hypothetical protein